MTSKRIFITGGAGFIGSHVAEDMLNSGHQVLIYDSLLSYAYPLELSHLYNVHQRLAALEQRARIIRGSTTDQDFLRRALNEFNPEIVVHLAAMPIANLARERPEEALDSIVSGTMNLLQAARELRRLERFVYISSSMVYGDFKSEIVDEEHPTKPKEVYGALKLSGELLTRAFGNLYGIEFSIVRPSAVYGATDNNSRVLSLFLENALADKPLLVRGAEQKLDFSYVGDVAHGICLAALHPAARGETFNITCGSGRSLLEAAQIIAGLAPNCRIELQAADPKMPSRGTLSIARAHELLGYTPRVKLESGLKIYFDYLQRRQEALSSSWKVPELSR